MKTKTKTASLVFEIRNHLGLTQDKFASQLGVTVLTVNRWENGHTEPSPMALKLLEMKIQDMGDCGTDLLHPCYAEV